MNKEASDDVDESDNMVLVENTLFTCYKHIQQWQDYFCLQSG